MIPISRTFSSRTYCVVIAWALFVSLVVEHASGAFLIEVDIDGMDDGILTYSPNFSFGPDTVTASQSQAGIAVGLTGGDSILGNGVFGGVRDTYVYTYDLAVDGDNLPLAAGIPLNNDGDLASGFAAGVSGIYRIYATWPLTNNVTGGPTTYTLTDDFSNELFSVLIDQNTAQGQDYPGFGVYAGDEWIFLASVYLDGTSAYTLTQQAVDSSFVSMRAAGILFDRVGIPEPTTWTLMVCCILALAARRTEVRLRR
jgi:hypothetical protein